MRRKRAFTAAVTIAIVSRAAAVQVGTLLLRTREAGTKPAHADALADPERVETVVTRAFSGRSARALRNRFTDEFSEAAVAEWMQHWDAIRAKRARRR